LWVEGWGREKGGREEKQYKPTNGNQSLGALLPTLIQGCLAGDLMHMSAKILPLPFLPFSLGGKDVSGVALEIDRVGAGGRSPETGATERAQLLSPKDSY
jgi:hypothetical protein